MRAKVSQEQLAGLRALLSVGLDDASRSDLASAARTVCALLEQRLPGGTVELRVPPFAAVQLGLGERGRHTRGTPPNVVQTDAVTLLELASGRLSWTDALASRRVRASGVLSDLGDLWPLPELA